MRNYFYLYGKGSTAQLYYVDSKRRASVVAAGSLWTNHPDRAWFGVGVVPTLLPIVGCN